MSMQQALGVVGGIVGAFFGYPQLGFVVGSLVGGLLTPKEKTEGPRLDDLKVQVSTYGSGVPVLNGTERINGNVVWSTNKIETSTTQEVGKGGGAENTSYRYFVHMRIVLCERPRNGSTVSLVQIFQDGKLKWDARSGIPVEQALASAENLFAFFTLYQGEATQLPDPVEEIYQGGPGTVPAHRGVVSISMKAIECPGGRVPQFSFVLSASATQGVEKGVIGAVPLVSAESVIALVGLERTLHISELSGGPYTLHPTLVGYGYTTTLPTINLPAKGDACTPVNGTEYESAFVVRDAGDYSGSTTVYFNNLKWLELINMQTGAVSHLLDYVGTDSTTCFLGGMVACYDPSTQKYAAAQTYDVSLNVYAANPIVINGGLAQPVGAAIPSGRVVSLAMYGDVLAVLNVRASNFYVVRYDASTMAFIDELIGPSSSGMGSSETIRAALRFDANGLFAWVPSTTGASVYSVGAAWSLLCADAENISSDKITGPTTFYADNNVCVIGPSAANPHSYDFIRFRAISTAPVKVKDIIADQCQRAGETRYDVSGIPDADTVHGYKIQNPASARANIDPLLTAFAIYAVDEDGYIKFKKYDTITSVATISYDELGQSEDGSEPADAMPLSRMQEIDLPKSVSCSYIEPTFDYQTATEKESRQVTQANEDLTIELPIATDSNRAKKVAQMVLFARWRAQNTRSLKVSRKYAWLSPGDGITVEYPRGTFRLWRIMSMTDTVTMIEFNVEPGDAAIYTQTAVGATGYVRQEVAALAPPTNLAIFDGPIMRDADNDAGLYALMEGAASGWAGAELFVGDDAATLVTRGTVSQEAVIGFTETALGNFSPNVVDETNLLTVNIGQGALSGITRAVLLSGTTNVAAVGINGRWEVIKFQRADSLGSGRYILSGLLRGQRGTEWAKGLHQVGEKFLLISTAGTLRPNLEAGSIGQTKSYRAVSKGRSFDSAQTQTFANTAEGLRPFAPTNLRKSLASGDITFSWVRRTRLSENWLAGVVPVGEASQAWGTVLYTDNTFTTIKRVIVSTTNSSIYTAAMQSTDGYSSGPLYVRVHQMSDVVGAGRDLEATI